MFISVHWLNRLLAPGNLTGAEAETVLTDLGLPLESRQPLPTGDERLDVEVTSNRGDCLSHLGIAREIAAATGRSLLLPALKSPPPSDHTTLAGFALDNTIADHRCPLFLARIIRGVRVGPSPDWLVAALESVGQRSVNTVVDCSNYVLFELGHPTHAFDLAALRGQRIVVRMARDKEPFTALDGRSHTLSTDDMVVADAERAVGLAGVIGGLDSSVTARTRDVLIEAATWDPAHVRRTARRRQIRTDSSHRYERIVDQRTTAFASARLAELILAVAGGTLEPGLAQAGRHASPPAVVRVRADRCRAILGHDLPTSEMARLLTALEIDAHIEPAPHAAGTPAPETLRCEVPVFRPDLTREIDLIEEIARTSGLHKIPVRDRITIEAHPPQASEVAARELASVLAGLGFFETVTFSFVTRDEASAWMPEGLRTLAVDEARRSGEPALRPSVVPSLLRCLRTNRHAGVRPEHGVRLFETASVFADRPDAAAVEHRNLALLVESPAGDGQAALRSVRGAIEAVVRSLGGVTPRVTLSPMPAPSAALSPGSCAGVLIDGDPAGYLGLVAPAALARAEIDESAVAAAEINLPRLLSLHPPKITIQPLPAFPAIERDLSVVVAEETPWARLAAVVTEVAPDRMEGVEFVGVYRGKQTGPGKKSVTMRLRFRDPSRTLRHEEVDPQVAAVVAALASRLGGELRK